MSDKFFPCVVFVNEGGGRIYGSSTNANQGILVEYGAGARSETFHGDSSPNVVAVRLKGFVTEYSLVPQDIQRIVCRFLSEQKMTLFLRNQYKVLVSRLPEPLGRDLIQRIVRAHPCCEICPPLSLTLLLSTPPRSAQKCTQPREKIDTSVHRPIAKKIRRHTSYAAPSLVDILPFDILYFIFRSFGVIPEVLPSCRLVYDIVCRFRKAITVRGSPRDSNRGSFDNSLVPSPTNFSADQLEVAVLRSRALHTLDCSRGVFLQSRHIESLFHHQAGGCHQFRTLSLRTSGRVSDAILRAALYTQRLLKRLNLINVLCNYDHVLDSLFYPRHLNRIIEALWIGKISYGDGRGTECTSFSDRTLARFWDSSNQGHLCTRPDDPTHNAANGPRFISVTFANCIYIREPLALKNVSDTLIELDVRGTRISDGAGSALLRTLTKLQYLNISSTPMGDETVSTALRSCPQLKIVDLSNLRELGQLNPRALLDLSSSWCSLECLSLADNNCFSGDVISKAISDHPTLRFLNLSRCLHLLPEFFTNGARTLSQQRQGRPSLHIVIKDSSITRASVYASLRPFGVSLFDTSEKHLFVSPYVPSFSH